MDYDILEFVAAGIFAGGSGCCDFISACAKGDRHAGVFEPVVEEAFL